jgi:hypothetical protein
MNLHGIVKSAIGVVNPMVPAAVRVSTGNVQNPDGTRTPVYATPGQFVGGISGTTLTVSAQASGTLMIGQLLTDEIGLIAPGTTITRFLSGPAGVAGGIGTYSVSEGQNVVPEVMATSLTLNAQVQALTFRDIAQLEGLNLQGTRRAIYLDGAIEGLVRPQNKGGDLITLPDGTVWLVAMVLEHWLDWCKVAATLQNNS